MYHCQQNKCYPIGVYLPVLDISQDKSFAHINKSQICYCDQIKLQSDAVINISAVFLTPLEVAFILLAIVYLIENFMYTHEQFNIFNYYVFDGRTYNTVFR